MAELYQRTWSLTVHDLRIDAPVDLGFSVEKSIASEPNKAQIKVFNLPKSEALRLSEVRRPAIQLRAGYGDGPPVLFLGKASRVVTEREGPDFVTTIEAEDAGDAWSLSRVSLSYPPGTSVSVVALDLVDALGIGRGNAVAALRGVSLVGQGSTYPQGTAVSGRAVDALTGLLRG